MMEPRIASVSAIAALGCALGLAACDRARAGNEFDIDQLPRLVADEEMRLGSVDDPDIGFSAIASVDVDDDGRIYVLEYLDRQIRVYDPDGTHVRRIGGPGSGPGEFEAVPFFGVVGDTVWAIDYRANRITLFDRDGHLLSTGRTDGVRIPLAHGWGYVLPRTMRPDGRFSGRFSRVAYARPDEPPSGISPDAPIPVPNVVFDGSGAVVDTIGWDAGPPPRMVPPPGYDADRFRTIQAGARRVGVPDPPTELPFWLALHEGRIVVESLFATTPDGTFTVTRIGLNGDTVYHRILRYRPARYASEELDSVAARAASGRAFAPAGQAVPPLPADYEPVKNAIRAALSFPEFRLPFRYAWATEDEAVWILRDDGEASVSRWVLLDAEAVPRGQLVLPAGVRPLWSHGDVFWAAVPDELDVPWLVRYRIRGS